MWMTRDLQTVAPTSTLATIAARMARHKIRRMPVVSESASGMKLLGIVSHSDLLHAFPPNINPFAVNAADSMAAIEVAAGGSRVTAADLIEGAARLMRDHKIGSLPVVSQHLLVGLITESDIFRALVEVFQSPGRAVRITFSLSPGEDVLPLMADIARRRSLRITSFMSLPRHEPPVCVVQLAGDQVEEALDDVWKSHHRVMNVVNLVPESTKPR
jgi:acetoin utilization protein AcuB